MAKQLVNPIERHIEKAVLGVAVPVLIVVIVLYLVSSPNRMDVGGESVLPATIDQKAHRKANSVRESIRNVDAPNVPPDPLYEDFLAELDPYGRVKLPFVLPAGAPMGPDVPIIDTPEPIAGQAALVKVVATGEPKATYGRSTFLMPAPDGQVLHSPRNWVTISAMLDVKQQMAEQRSAYGATRKEVVFGPIQLQRRARRIDGSWSDGDWQDMTPWPAAQVPPIPDIPLLSEEDRIVVPRADLSNVEKFFDGLRATTLQWGLLRPMPAEIVNGDKWTFPVITTYRDVLMQDDQYGSPDELPATDPIDRYQEGRPQVVRAREEVLTPAQMLKKARQHLESAWQNKSINDAKLAFNLAFDVNKSGKAGAGDRSKAQKLMAEAEQREKDVQRWQRRHGGQGIGQGGGDPKNQARREPLPRQQIWVHDTAQGSVKSGTSYQYRLRPSIYNRLAGQPGKFRNTQDAAVVFIPGKWTAPVEVEVEPDTLFFVTSKNKQKREVGIELFRWFEGVWVKARGKFDVGQLLEVARRVEVPSDDPTLPDRPMVGFAADAALVDIDFDRFYRGRKRGSGRGGVKFDRRSTACCVVFSDAAGRLHERFVATDRGHPGKRLIANKVWSPPR